MITFYRLIWWLNPAAYTTGLCVAVWAFRKCRKIGYLVIAAFFALAVYSLVAAPFVNRAIASYRTPDMSMETEKRLNDAVQETSQRILAEAGVNSIAYSYSVDFPLGSILLVTGLWLVARKEREIPNQTLDATSEIAPSADSSAHKG